MTDATEPYRPSLAARSSRVGRLCLKELREILRDRRTIVTLVLMPLMVYPLMAIAFQQFLLTHLAPQGPPSFRLGFANESDLRLVMRYLSMAEPGSRLRREEGGSTREEIKQVAIKMSVTANLDQSVREFQTDLGVRVVGDHWRNFDPLRDLSAEVEVVYLENSPIGRQAVEFFRERLEGANEWFLRTRLRALKIKQPPLPVRMKIVELVDRRTTTQVSLAAAIPLILILMTITGAVYPAIDLTAGERERGTIEVLIAAPVPRLGLLLAKYVAVMAVAVLTGAVNLLTMTLTVMVSGLGSMLFGPEGLSVETVGQVFALMLLFAAFFSAVLLAMTSYARSFKEAQAYLVPIMLLSLAPGMMSLMPGLKLSRGLQVVPVLNVVLLARDVFEGASDSKGALVVVICTLLYSLAAIGIAARIFGAESTLYSTQGSWSDLLRRPRRRRATPSISSALLLLAFSFPVLFLSLGAIVRLGGRDIGHRMLLGAGVTLVLFGIVPFLLAWRGRVTLRSGLNLRRPPLGSWFGAVILGACLWPIATQIVVWEIDLGLVTIPEEAWRRAREVADQVKALPPWLVVLCLAVVPAACEELFFRGYLQSALAAELSAWRAIATSAIFFGVFHLLATQAFTLERLPPSAFLGLILGWVCWRTGSVWPGILIHLLHNSLMTMLPFWEDSFKRWGWSANVRTGLPASWVIAGIVGSLLGLAIVRGATPTSPAGARERDVAGAAIT